MNQSKASPATAVVVGAAALAAILTVGGLYLIEALLGVELSAHWGLASFPLAALLMFVAWRRYQRVDGVDRLAAAAFIVGAGIIIDVIYAIVGLSAGSLWAMAVAIMSMWVFVRTIG